MASIVHTDTPYLDRMGTKALLEEIKERIPGADIDMSDYYKKEQVDAMLPKNLSELRQDNDHQTVSAAEKEAWDNKATETFVRNAIASAELSGEGGEVDLSGYATTDDLADLASKTYVDNAVSNATPNLTNYATKTYVNNAIPSLSGYATQTYVNNAIAQAELDGNSNVDLSGYATVDHTHSEYASTNHTHSSIEKASTVAPVASSNETSNANVECPVEGLRHVDVYEPGSSSQVPIPYGNMLQLRSGDHNHGEGQSGFAHEMLFGTDNKIYHRSHGDYGDGNKWENWKRLADIDEVNQLVSNVNNETIVPNVKVDVTDNVFNSGETILRDPKLPQLPTFSGGTKLHVTPPSWSEDYWADPNVAVRMKQDGYLLYENVYVNEDDTKDYVLIPNTEEGFIDDYELFGSDYSPLLTFSAPEARKVNYLVTTSPCPADLDYNGHQDPYFVYDGVTKVYDSVPLIKNMKDTYYYVQPYVTGRNLTGHVVTGYNYSRISDQSQICFIINYDVSNLTGSVVVRFNAFYPKYDPNTRVSSHYDGAGNYTPITIPSTSKYKISNVPSYQGAKKCRITALYLCNDLSNTLITGTTINTADVISKRITEDYAEIIVDVTNRNHLPLMIWGPKVGVYESDTYYGNAPVENLTTTSWAEVALYANPIVINHDSTHPDYDPDFDSSHVVAINFGINPADIKNAPITISRNTEGVDTEYSIWTTNIDGTETSEVTTLSFDKPSDFGSKDVLRYSNEPICTIRNVPITEHVKNNLLSRAELANTMAGYIKIVNDELDENNERLAAALTNVDNRATEIATNNQWKLIKSTNGRIGINFLNKGYNEICCVSSCNRWNNIVFTIPLIAIIPHQPNYYKTGSACMTTVGHLYADEVIYMADEEQIRLESWKHNEDGEDAIDVTANATNTWYYR